VMQARLGVTPCDPQLKEIVQGSDAVGIVSLDELLGTSESVAHANEVPCRAVEDVALVNRGTYVFVRAGVKSDIGRASARASAAPTHLARPRPRPARAVDHRAQQQLRAQARKPQGATKLGLGHAPLA
jgi:hypothetical protein